MKNKKTIKILENIFTGHQATPAEWEAARAKIDSGHQYPHGDLFLKIGRSGRVVAVRADEEGNLFLDFQD